MLSGMISGLLGVGGGLVVSPMLLMSGLPLQKATGTALAVIPWVALMAVVADVITLPGNLDVGLALAIAVGGPFGVRIGHSFNRRLPLTSLRIMFQTLLVFTALRSLGLFGSLSGELAQGFAGGSLALEYSIAAMLGIAAGICSILFGVGGGVVVVPGLLLLVGGMDFRAATAASLLAMIPTTVFSLRLAASDGRVVRSFLPQLLGGAIPIAALAVWLRNSWMQPQTLNLLFGVFLLFVALKLGLRRPTNG